MKVGIFGDSYCCNNIYLIRDKPDHTFQKSWVDHLENEENIKVNNHARPGSNLHYSFTQFKKHHNEYDKIIFVVTNWGRIWVPNFNRPCIPGLAYCEHMLKNCTDEDRIIFQAAHDYFMYLENETEKIDIHKLMVNEIINLRNDALLIPAFKDSFVTNWEGPCLSNISDIDDKFFNVPMGTPDWRHCHFNDENNLIFFKKIINWCHTGLPFSINLADYVLPNKPREYYYRD